ncbi:hypothetical protein [Novipirellula galeiformis]|uniref:hypothetical protein n=1 Tax=Novipirellula galeiformis TaxID=2528004 RepID=UPI0018CF7AC3|nr:hypothetical protein [Novipirellula galeiformis]
MDKLTAAGQFGCRTPIINITADPERNRTNTRGDGASRLLRLAETRWRLLLQADLP